MTAATKLTDKPHARIYAHWRQLPAWRELRPLARLLLVEMLTDYRPGQNGFLEWPLRRVQEVLECGRAHASSYLLELEKAGWITCERIGKFGGSRPASRYALTMFPNNDSALPSSHAYMSTRPPYIAGARRRLSGRKGNLDRSRTEQEQVSSETTNCIVSYSQRRQDEGGKPMNGEDFPAITSSEESSKETWLDTATIVRKLLPRTQRGR